MLYVDRCRQPCVTSRVLIDILLLLPRNPDVSKIIHTISDRYSHKFG